MKKILYKLGITKFGFVELLIALFPIMAGYSYSPIYFSFVIPLLLIIYCIHKRVPIYNNKPLKYFAIFLVFHEVALTLFCPYVGVTPIANVIGDVTHVLIILFIIKLLNYERLRSAIMLVAAISSFGILYHFYLIRSGQMVSPIPLPFLPDPGPMSRLHELGVRPVSFFWEPAAYASYMIIPLFISLLEKRFVSVGFCLFFIFLSTSTLGIVLSTVTIVAWVALSEGGKWSKIAVMFFGAAIIYLVTQTTIFEAGLNKINETNLEETARTINGPALAENMSFSDFLFGLPDNSPTDYWKKGKIQDVRFVGKDELYLSTLWYVLAKLGIVGFILYMSVIFSAVQRNKQVLTLVLVLFVSLFSSNMYIGPQFVFYFTFIYLLKYRKSLEDGYKA